MATRTRAARLPRGIDMRRARPVCGNTSANLQTPFLGRRRSRFPPPTSVRSPEEKTSHLRLATHSFTLLLKGKRLLRAVICTAFGKEAASWACGGDRAGRECRFRAGPGQPSALQAPQEGRPAATAPCTCPARAGGQLAWPSLLRNRQGPPRPQIPSRACSCPQIPFAPNEEQGV